MDRIRKVLLKLFIVMILVLGTTSFTGIPFHNITVEAQVKKPVLKLKDKTLYTGYKTYKMQLYNIASGAKITYKSSNKKVATVSKGLVKSVCEGKTVITAEIKQNKKTYTLKLNITVKNPSVAITDGNDFIKIGDSCSFKADVEGMDNKVVWSTSDPSLASISSDGVVTGKSAGCVTVYAKAGTKSERYVTQIIKNGLGTLSTDVTIYETTKIWITSYSNDENENLTLDKTESSVAAYEMGQWSGRRIPITITPKTVGSDTITVTSGSTGEKLAININVINKPEENKLTSTQIYGKCVPCTVEIVATGDTGTSLGSGFFIGNGRIVTNYHVIEGAYKITVITSDKQEYEIKNILGYNSSLDLAILELNISHDYLSLCQNADGGEDVYTLGNPLGLTGTMTKGMISTASRVFDDVDYIQIDASISQGNSGGPLINSYGEVIGINTMYFDGGQNLNFAINIKELQKIDTENPLSVADYYLYYNDIWRYWSMSNAISEDPVKSQLFETCQDITPGFYRSGSVSVLGSIAKYEIGDCYYINADKACKLNAILQAENTSDLHNMYFVLLNYAGTLLDSGKLNEAELTQVISSDINSGEYILCILLPDGYKGSAMDYMFSTYFE